MFLLLLLLPHSLPMAHFLASADAFVSASSIMALPMAPQAMGSASGVAGGAVVRLLQQNNGGGAIGGGDFEQFNNNREYLPDGGSMRTMAEAEAANRKVAEAEENAENGAEDEDEEQNLPPVPPSTPIAREPAWMRSGKFQGDIDGVDEQLIRQLQDPAVQFNALRNRQLIWPGGIIPYELDLAFSLSEARLLQRAFRTYRKRTLGCIRFRPRRNGESDFLNIVKGNGCYSQVGKTGGKQELSLGRGCLFNETIIHELMHSLGFWHEHSRADRDEHIIIRWENILPGMDSQFDIVSSAIQDTLGEPYDYRSIMHYGSSAFSRNGRNTLEAVVDEFTNTIGTAIDLSELDVVKIMKLYRCRRRDTSAAAGSWRGSSNSNNYSYGPWRRRKSSSARRHLANQSPPASSSASSSSTAAPAVVVDALLPEGEETAEGAGHSRREEGPLGASAAGSNEAAEEAAASADISGEERTSLPLRLPSSSSAAVASGRGGGRRRCRDHFLDCPQFRDYCKRISFYFIMRSYCPATCGRCATASGAAHPLRATSAEAEEEEGEFIENQERW